MRRAVLLALATAACSFEHFDVSGGPGPDATGIDARTAIDGGPDSGADGCVADPAGERCNGVDDDCDGETDEVWPELGSACDGSDSDLCDDDVYVCDGTQMGTLCSQGGDDDVELCNFVDDDCDGDTDEDFATLGDPCDAATDTDLCAEGVIVCDAPGTGVVCEEDPGDAVELCNALDDDCDGMTDEGFMLGAACDGADGDLCQEGVIVCNAGGAVCGDTTTTNVEQCNGSDDDCDGTTDEGFDLLTDESNCGVCGNTCTNSYGSNTCIAGVCIPTCSGGAARDCDGDPDNGCEPRNQDPSCTTTVTMLGAVNGDSPSSSLVISGYGEAWFLVHVDETNTTEFVDLTLQASLANPAGVDYDLYVRCTSCGGSVDDSSILGPGMTDITDVGRTDVSGFSDFDVIIEVRYASATTCSNWTLTVTGDVVSSNMACP